MSILISPPTTASKPRYLSFNSLENLILSLSESLKTKNTELGIQNNS